jgi:hypothetical protein
MVHSFLEQLNRAVNRRGFLNKGASACSALVVALFGLDHVALAGGVPGCCHLCSTTMCNTQTCAAKWCWTCPHGTGDNCTIYTCLECYSVSPGGDCVNTVCDEGGGFCTCNYVICSKATNTFMGCL